MRWTACAGPRASAACRPDRARRGQPRRGRRLGRAHRLGRVPGRDAGHALAAPRSACASPRPGSRRCRPTRRRRRRSGSRRCWRRKASPTTSPPIATRRRACGSGAAPRSRRADIAALLPWLDWACGRKSAPNTPAAGRGVMPMPKVLIADKLSARRGRNLPQARHRGRCETRPRPRPSCARSSPTMTAWRSARPPRSRASCSTPRPA